LPKDHIRLKLTETIATDVSDASTTLLFDVKRRCWSKSAFWKKISYRKFMSPSKWLVKYRQKQQEKRDYQKA